MVLENHHRSSCKVLEFDFQNIVVTLCMAIKGTLVQNCIYIFWSILKVYTIIFFYSKIVPNCAVVK